MNKTEAPTIAPLAASDGEPAFAEPWQASVLALAFALSEAGTFSPTQWSDSLGLELREAAERDEPDTQETYYLAALRALEGLLAEGGAITDQNLAARVEAWRQAYLTTPHGQPVELGSQDKPDKT